MKKVNENNMLVATQLLDEAAKSSLDLAVWTSKAAESTDVITSALNKFKALGYSAIQDGRRKGSKPNTNEFPYVAFATLAKSAFIERKKRVSEVTKSAYVAPTESSLRDFTKQFQQSVSCYLEFGIWVPNVGRDKEKTLIAAGLIKAPKEAKEAKESNKKGTRTPSAFDAKKIADNMSVKYTTSQMIAVIVELQALVA